MGKPTKTVPEKLQARIDKLRSESRITIGAKTVKIDNKIIFGTQMKSLSTERYPFHTYKTNKLGASTSNPPSRSIKAPPISNDNWEYLWP